MDPLDALASSLPSADPVAPPQPVYTGPEVKEVKHSPECVYTKIGEVFDCSELRCNRVLCVYHSLGSSLRRDTSVEKEMTRCLQATDLKIWSVPSGVLLLFLTCLDSLLGHATLWIFHLILSSVG